MKMNITVVLVGLSWGGFMLWIGYQGWRLKFEARVERLRLLESIVRMRGKRAGRRPGKLPFCTCTMTWGADGARDSVLDCKGIHKGEYSGNQPGNGFR